MLNDTVTLTALIDDHDHGGQNISGAEYTVDRPFWEPGADLHPLNPVSSDLNSPVEEFRVELDLAKLSPGRHMIFVRGQDAEDNLGVTKAVFLDVPDPADPVLRLTFLPFAISE